MLSSQRVLSMPVNSLGNPMSALIEEVKEAAEAMTPCHILDVKGQQGMDGQIATILDGLFSKGSPTPFLEEVAKLPREVARTIMGLLKKLADAVEHKQSALDTTRVSNALAKEVTAGTLGLNSAAAAQQIQAFKDYVENLPPDGATAVAKLISFVIVVGDTQLPVDLIVSLDLSSEVAGGPAVHAGLLSLKSLKLTQGPSGSLELDLTVPANQKLSNALADKLPAIQDLIWQHWTQSAAS